MLNHSASITISTSVLEALPGKFDIKIHSPSISRVEMVHYVGLDETKPVFSHTQIRLLSYRDYLEN